MPGTDWDRQLAAHRGRLQQANLWRSRHSVDSPQGAIVERAGRRWLNFCSNDYLGLANHPQVVEAARDALGRWGAGSGAAHLVCGHMAPHQQLERELAEFVGAERALLFSTGYMANLAAPAALLGRHDLILSDRLNHASLIDAARLSRATVKRFRHLDSAQVKLSLADSAAARKLILSDAVFSMDGDRAPLGDYAELCDEYGALLLIDDAHGFGVCGVQGAGSLSAAGLSPAGRVLMMGTLGKACGSFGAFIAGDKTWIDMLVQTARPYIYTTAIPPAIAEASRAALRLIHGEDWRRERLSKLVRRFRLRAAQAGLPLMHSDSPIQPLLIGDSARAIAAGECLEEQGIWVTAIRPPTVPAGSARLRITISAAHSDDDVDRLLTALTDPAFKVLLPDSGTARAAVAL